MENSLEKVWAVAGDMKSRGVVDSVQLGDKVQVISLIMIVSNSYSFHRVLPKWKYSKWKIVWKTFWASSDMRSGGGVDSVQLGNKV